VVRANVAKAQGDVAGARAIVKEALVGAKVPQDGAIRTHRYVKALTDLEAGLPK
jgi:hypothetical protein